MARRTCRGPGALLALAALALSACHVSSPTTTAGTTSSTTTALTGGLSVGGDPTDLIHDAAFVEWEDLPLPGQSVRPPDSGHLGVAQVLPGSEPRRLYIAVWHNTCMPVVTVSAPDPGSAPQLSVAIGQHPGEQCGDLLQMWPFEVTLNRDVNPATIVLQVNDRRPY
jgi:hypothetical protein